MDWRINPDATLGEVPAPTGGPAPAKEAESEEGPAPTEVMIRGLLGTPFLQWPNVLIIEGYVNMQTYYCYNVVGD